MAADVHVSAHAAGGAPDGPGNGLRLLFICRRYPPAFSGSGLQARRLAACLARSGCRVAVLTAPGGTASAAPEATSEEHAVRVHRVGSNSPFDAGPLRGRGWAVGASVRFFRMRADIVHFHGLTELEPLLALSIARRKRTIVKLAVSGEAPACAAGAAGRWAKVDAGLLRRVDRVIATSARLREDCLGAGVPSDRVARIPNGVDLQAFRPVDADVRRELRKELSLPLERILIVSLGRLGERKRQKMQVGALARLSGEDRPVTLLLAGPADPSYLRELEEEAASSGAARRLLLRAYADPDDARKALQAADIFTLTSRREGLPNSVLEAMACAVTPVVTSLPGVTDELVAHDADGIVLRQDSEEELAQAWKRLIASDEERRRLGQAARRRVEENHDLERIAQRYLDLYADLVRAR